MSVHTYSDMYRLTPCMRVYRVISQGIKYPELSCTKAHRSCAWYKRAPRLCFGSSFTCSPVLCWATKEAAGLSGLVVQYIFHNLRQNTPRVCNTDTLCCNLIHDSYRLASGLYPVHSVQNGVQHGLARPGLSSSERDSCNSHL